MDYAQLVKLYGSEGGVSSDKRYSPAECTGIRKRNVEGKPDPAHVSTSYVERSNLSMRMGNRRMTRLTNAFSKKAENHAHMMAISAAWYKFHTRCPFAQDRCRAETPEWREIDDDHFVECHFSEELSL